MKKSCIVLVMIALAGCSGGTSLESDTGGPVDTTGADRQGGDVAAPDLQGDYRFADTPAVDTFKDLGRHDGPPLDLGTVCDMPPYPFGCPCAESADCASGWCVDTADGKQCTSDCAEECPEGWSCVTVAGSCPDCQQICLPLWTHVCQPCTDNDQCFDAFTAGSGLCVVYGTEGRFCGATCETPADCPAGFACEEVEAVGGFTKKQCVLETGECPCSAKAIADGAQTKCQAVNEHGSCWGWRVCTEEGLSECDAATPTPEYCDGADNDCDNMVDEDEGICTGGKICSCAGDLCGCICPPGLTDCGDGICVDTQTSTAHCGGCGKPCVADHVETAACQEGVCKVVKCAPGWENFDQAWSSGCECEILAEVCDGVDNDCDGLKDEGDGICPGVAGCEGACVQGVCQCPPGCELCNGLCADQDSFLSDASNCGFCGNVCALPDTVLHSCEDGQCCPVACANGYKDCDEICSTGCEFQVKPELCNLVDEDCDGEIDEPPFQDCLPPKICLDGWCQCPTDDPDIVDCGEGLGCKNIATDAMHCGWCGNDCAALGWLNVSAYSCEESVCGILACANPFVDVNEVPWDGCECQQTSPVESCDLVDNDCDGEVDEAPFSDCPSPLLCQGGFCACDFAQPNLQECVNDQCNDTFTDVNHCGFCGNKCADLAWPDVQVYACADGLCGIGMCKPGYFDVNESSWDGCECLKTAQVETCDLVDNNCNGQVDETPNNCIPPKVCLGGQCVCPPEQPNLQDCGGPTCTNTDTDPNNCGFCGNVCALSNVSFQSCQAGECKVVGCKPGWKDCDTEAPTGCEFQVQPEECNGFDDDCDLQIDEGAAGVGQPCQTGLPGLCANGTQTCSNGMLSCTPNIQPGQYSEVCDNQDNDCNGQVDDAVPQEGANCTVPNLQGVCKAGKMHCTAGQLTCTQEVFPSEEVCDAQDNDCNGTVDQIVQPCSTACEAGTSTCVNGNWQTCTALAPKMCTNYATCQQEQMCVVSCPQAPAEQCNGMDEDCDGGVDEVFQCVLGNSQNQNCGFCGTQSRNCLASCSWSSWSSCSGQGVCSQGQTETQSCGLCGTQTRTCTSQCQWGSWSTCSGQGTCTPGQSQSQTCGYCGTQSRTCSSSCNWGSWSTCSGQGVCSAGQTQTQSCGNCGSQSRTCSSSCQWGTWGSCLGTGVCSPGSSSACTDACGTRTCSSSCAWNTCSFTKDSYEPNETWAQAEYWGTFEEGASISPITQAWLHQAEPGYANPGEVDRFYFYCNESGSLFDWTMAMSATFSGIGGWHYICIYYDRGCNGGVDVEKCTSGSGSLTVNTGDVDANDGTNDSGCVDIMVYGDWSCSKYTLQMSCN